MANVNDGINAYVNRLVRDTLYSDQFTARPLLYFLTAQGQHQADALIRPYGTKNNKYPNDNWKYGVSMGGKMGLAKRIDTLGSVNHEFRFQKQAADGLTNVQPGAATPTATGFSEDFVGTTATHWTTDFAAYKVRNANLRAARGKTKLASILEEALGMTYNAAFNSIQSQLWTGTQTSAQQANQEWSQLLGLDHLVSDGSSSGETSFTHIGRVNRTVETHLKSKVLIGSTLVTNGNIPTTQPTLDLISQILTDDALGGICNKAGGTGDLVIVPGDMWNTLRAEAESQANIEYNASQKIGNTGRSVAFKQPVIEHGKSRIVYDPDCPSGTMFVLSSGSLCYEISPGMNYKITGLRDKGETEEGGEDYSWGKVSIQHRLTMTAPWLSVKVTGLAA